MSNRTVPKAERNFFPPPNLQSSGARSLRKFFRLVHIIEIAGLVDDLVAASAPARCRALPILIASRQACFRVCRRWRQV